jgi:phosphoserine aminotransferase
MESNQKNKNLKPLNFYPGPSKLYPNVEKYAMDAFDSGILERNHRSLPFMAMLEKTIELFKIKLDVPINYKVFFTSSSTECWEICAQSLFSGKIQFLYNGAFGKKWFKYAVTNPQVNSFLNFKKSEIRGSRFFIDNQVDELELDKENNVLCVVGCETSNGTSISSDSLKSLNKSCPNALIMVDATSSMGGDFLDFSLADVWFASSQKCFGLPSGLGILIVSPKAQERAIEINERNHYNSLIFMEENFNKFQTNYTPNILGIYLLGRLLEDNLPIQEISKKLFKRASFLYSEIARIQDLELLVKNPLTRSNTVLAIKSDSANLIITEAKKRNILIGNGYGEWKENTFRIANFPAIKDEEFEMLLLFLKTIL